MVLAGTDLDDVGLGESGGNTRQVGEVRQTERGVPDHSLVLVFQQTNQRREACETRDTCVCVTEREVCVRCV